MTLDEDLIALERDAWQALSTSGDAAADLYARLLDDEVLMLLPGGLVIDDRRRVIDSMRGAPWDDVQLSDERVFWLGDDCAVVAYRARATRDTHSYEAWFNSTYVRGEGGWRLALHQQTPV